MSEENRGGFRKIGESWPGTGVSVPVFVTESWHFLALGFCFFLGLGLPRGCRDLFGFFDALNAAPLMRAIALDALRWPVREAEQIGRPMLGVSGAALMGHLQEAQRNGFSHTWRDRMSVQSVLTELIERNREFAVVGAAAVAVLNLNPVDHASSREA